MRPDQIIAEIVKRRHLLGLTQAQLAARAGISRRTMVAIEAGAHDIGIRKLIRLLDSTGLTLTVKEGKDRPTESELSELFREDDE
ncbi:helix-turn-helix domain-containing protein [Noviherbaspirillum sp.]|uniref:helix-turn-helix domain-containing protein n=1 Tax=Noviherbaspirillum sp. TaxID=1926288 RepID=UPI002FE2736F